MKFEEPIGIIMQIDSKMLEVQAAQDMAGILDVAKRKQQKLNEIKAWSDPEAVAARYKKHEEDAAAALERGKLMANEYEDIPIPDPLPKEMRGQSLSTIRAMLRQRMKPELDIIYAIHSKPSTFHVRSK